MEADSWEYEICWLGSATPNRSGDCVIIRWGTLGKGAEQKIAVIDAGRKSEDVNRLKATLQKMSAPGDPLIIDYLIGTHSDNDHIGQFKKLLDDEDIGIGQLWIMNPYNHAEQAYDNFPDLPTMTSMRDDVNCVPLARESLIQRPVAASLRDVDNIVFHPGVLEDNVEIVEPFAGTQTPDGCLTVLGPSKEYYIELLPNIFPMDKLIDAATDRGGELAALLFLAAKKHPSVQVIANESQSDRTTEVMSEWNPEDAKWDSENLQNGPGNPTNNASLIMLFKTPHGSQILFTGDAAVPAFESAASSMTNHGFNAAKLKILQLPHHGSKGNVSSAILDKLLGEKLDDQESAEQKAEQEGRTCIAMSGATDYHHASGEVSDAVARRGWRFYQTNSQALWFPSVVELVNAVDRENTRFGENPKDRGKLR